ncbi:guanosine-diphosphatase [Ceratobasidium sp. AG-Ba]|nr:guanosine-diphosphatase [Ceratobasidium sp. AG-Ba]
MPPPTAGTWFESRRFGIVIDAGSSGSRLQIYSWKDPRAIRSQHGSSIHDKLPRIEKGTIDGADWVIKVEPGLSTFADKPSGVAAYLRPLLAHALVHIPPSLRSETPIFLLATAACDFLRFYSKFKVDDINIKAGLGAGHGCGSSVRIITGEEEGLFGWLAVNYLLDGFDAHSRSQISDGSNKAGSTYGFLDMGGASTQIAYEPSHEEQAKPQNQDLLVDVRLRLLGGDEIRHRVFVTTWLGYGTNQARERYVDKAILDSSKSGVTPADHSTLPVIGDPCLPVGLLRRETHLDPSSGSTSRTMIGLGSFSKCIAATAPLLNKNAPCPDSRSCLFNGVPAPPIDFSSSHFIGVSEYWYSSEHSFGLGGAYDYVSYERAASQFCNQKWEDIVAAHDRTKAELGKEGLGGDGQVEKHGQVTDVGQWGRDVELKRLEMQCFKAAWIVNVLHEGIGIPRIIDPNGNSAPQNVGAEAIAKAEDKGLGRNTALSGKKPTFQSMDSVNDTAISWTLGKMVIEACKDIPAASKQAVPIADPMQPVPDLPAERPGFIDFDALEDSISHRLPQRLTRHSLGFSPVAFAFYLTVFAFWFYMLWRMRTRLRAFVRRWRRILYPNEQADRMQYAMEGGQTISSPIISRPSTPSFHNTQAQSTKFASMLRASLKEITAPLSRASSPFQNKRASSYPISPYENGNSPGTPVTATTARPYHLSVNTVNGTRSSAPSPNSPALGSFNGMTREAASSSLQTPLYSLSRNSSAVNLTTIMPRSSTAMSRQTSNGHTPSSSHDD